MCGRWEAGAPLWSFLPYSQLEALDAEDRLAYACEKAPTNDPVLNEVWCGVLVQEQCRWWLAWQSARPFPPQTHALRHPYPHPTPAVRSDLQLRAAFLATEAEFKAVTELEKQEVVALGGLHVVGTERHESRRIDNQVSP